MRRSPAPEAQPESCATPGCRNLAKPRSLWCSTCHWRRQRNLPMDSPRRARNRSPEETLREAARALSACEDTSVPWWKLREWNRLRVAAMRWLKAKGWTPPPPTRPHVGN